MERFRNPLLCLAALGVLVSCTVISKEIRSEAEPPVSFKTLVDQADQFVGRTVILGGYILETRNIESETVIEVLQVPMRIGEEPDLKDSSEGRFFVYHKEFLDPEIYSKDRVITVAGVVLGTGDKAIGDDRIRYLKIENREIYLWPEFQKYPSPYPYPIWPYPYHWHRYPFYRHHYWYW
jgi:outer membrane lipoprotein